mmetsp:Transcript_28743/g.51146  ORF Transcript_28743/g.51146 Transcript_28743/m.51146 type:complete len:112 (-) Transcript_28743:86-421(-)
MVRLREVIMQFYVSCLQGLNEAKQADIIYSHLPQIIDYSLLITQENYTPSHDINLSTCGLIGDSAVAFGNKATQYLNNPHIQGYLNKHSASSSHKVREVALWAIKQVSGLR